MLKNSENNPLKPFRQICLSLQRLERQSVIIDIRGVKNMHKSFLNRIKSLLISLLSAFSAAHHPGSDRNRHVLRRAGVYAWLFVCAICGTHVCRAGFWDIFYSQRYIRDAYPRYMKDLQRLYEQKRVEINRFVIAKNQEQYARHLEFMRREAQRNPGRGAENLRIAGETAMRFLEFSAESKITPEQRAGMLPGVAKSAEIFVNHRDLMIENIKKNRRLVPTLLNALDGGMRVLAEFKSTQRGKQKQAGETLEHFLTIAGDIGTDKNLLAQEDIKKLTKSVVSGITDDTFAAWMARRGLDGKNPQAKDIVAAARITGTIARMIEENGPTLSPQAIRALAAGASKIVDLIDKNSKKITELGDRTAQDVAQARAVLIKLMRETAEKPNAKNHAPATGR